MEIQLYDTISSVEHSYTVLRLVGQGTFGKVYEAIDENNNRVAIKRVEKSSNFISREVDILAQISHRNCIKLLDVFYSIPDETPDRKFQNMVFDFCNHTLSSYVKSHRPGPDKAKIMFGQLCSALKYMHDRRICHRDLTPNNVLVNNEGEVKIADFGSAKMLEENHVSMNYICSRFYRAPELLLGCTDYSTKIDIWSAGCIMMELFTGKPLFPGVDTQDQMIKIVLVLGTPSLSDLWAMKRNQKPPKFPKIEALRFADLLPKGTPDSDLIADLLSGMLCYNPHNRFTIDDVVSHPYFTGTRSVNSSAKAMTSSPLGRIVNSSSSFDMFDLQMQDMKLTSINAPSIACGAGVARV